MLSLTAQCLLAAFCLSAFLTCKRILHMSSPTSSPSSPTTPTTPPPWKIPAASYRNAKRLSLLDSSYSSLPVVGVPEGGILRWFRAQVLAVTRTANNAVQGYNDFCKARGIPFVVPSTGLGAVVALPPSDFDVLSWSTHEVIAFDAQIESIQAPYMFSSREVWANPIHFDIVRKHLWKDVGYFAEMTAVELDAAFSEIWGSTSSQLQGQEEQRNQDLDSEEFRTVNAFSTLSQVIARTANRALMGESLCRNPVILEQSGKYANAVYVGACIINALPEAVRPLLGPLIAIPAKRYLARCQEIMVPFVKARLTSWAYGQGDDKMPNDALQWMIEKCAKTGSEREMQPENISQRLLILNLVSIYTTTYAFANVILDIYSDHRRDEIVAGLRDECSSVGFLYSSPDFSTKQSVDALYRVDSAIRESMRLNAFGILSLPRIVAPGSGITLKSGHHLQPGTRVCVPSQAIHRDADQYRDPLQFDAFRFSRDFERANEVQEKVATTAAESPSPRTRLTTPERDETAEAEARRRKSQPLSVTCTKSFLTYGYGKHACPGRWFAAQLMKQALAYVVMSYDVKVVGPKLERKALLAMVLPPTDTMIKVRRRH